MKKKGAFRLSFDTIAASGIRSSLPHGIHQKKYWKGILTLFRCVYNGYCSDMTSNSIYCKVRNGTREIYVQSKAIFRP